MPAILNFLLVPDSGASRRVRRVLAEGGARTGVVVGTWLELLEHAADAYLLPAQRDDWDSALHISLRSMPDAFWAGSLEVAPGETMAEVESALSRIVSASDPAKGPDGLDTGPLPQRPRKHVDDIITLVQSLNGALPDELATIRGLLAADAADAIRLIHVSWVDGVPPLARWQASLVDKLNNDAGVPEDPEPAAILTETLSPSMQAGRVGEDPAATRHGDDCRDAGGGARQQARAEAQDDEAIQTSVEAGEPESRPAPTIRTSPAQQASQTSLARLQTDLFHPPAREAPLDDSIQWIGVRDYLAEVELAAGMIQTMLDAEAGLRPADVGLLMPDDYIYAVAVDDVFARAGLPVSGLPFEHWQRDLGREALFHFLYCRQKPAPAMALAVCLSSPLMPWSREDGAVLAQTVMDGDYRLRPFREADRRARAMLDLVREGDENPLALARALRDFADLLDGGDAHAGHVHQARATADQLSRSLESAPAIDWTALRQAASPQTITTGQGPDFNLEGITVWRESQEPWRPVRHLIVFGFASGHYPVASAQSPVFAADDLNAIRDHLGLMLDTPADALSRRRARFKRQLARASGSVSFLVPRRTADGAARVPSESLVFMHKLFETPEADGPEDLILELDAAADRERMRFPARAGAAGPQPPRAIVSADPRFDRDLLALRTDEAGNQKPESPSSLETLMVSRLAWLLRRLNAEPLGWAPETLDPMLMGTLAHQVFEALFPSGRPLPDQARIQTQVGPLLEDTIARSAPFLRAAQWQVERRHLTAEITKAALAWREILSGLGTDVLANEIWLAGELNGVPIHGQADALLGLSDNRLLVVDYKRSSTGSRKPRMEKGCDSQASLYRTMLQTGGPKNEAGAGLLDRLRQPEQAGIVYYMMNDQTALSDSVLAESGTIPGWDPVDGDVAGGAIALIEQHLREVRQGRLSLNRASEVETFEKDTGIKPYALDNSPLIALFTMDDQAGKAE